MINVRSELKLKYPKVARNAVRQPKAAIKLFCLECVGGDYGEAKRCAESSCSLWPYAFKRGKAGAPDTDKVSYSQEEPAGVP